MQAGDFINTLPKLPDPSLMKIWDNAAEKFGIPGNMLTENAGSAIFSKIERFTGNVSDNLYWVFMGGGNNGGDAACVARYLYDHDAYPLVFHLKPLIQLRGAAAWHVNLARENGVKFIELNLENPLDNMTSWLMLQLTSMFPHRPRLIIDGLIGAGFSGELKQEMASIITAINEISDLLHCPIFAIDVPSGLNALTGMPSPVAISAVATITLAAAKPGLVMSDARAWCGDVYVESIGFPKAIESECPTFFRLLDGTSLLGAAPLPENSYKNIFGHLYVIGGSAEFTGAAHLACASALRTGAGLITACAPPLCLGNIKNGWPEIMTLPLGEDYKWPGTLSENIKVTLKKANALVVGPGLGRGQDSADFLQKIVTLPDRPPTVFDADALIILAANPELFKYITEKDILTPHPGEAAALLNCSGKDIQRDRRESLRKLLELTPATVILKGANTILGQSGETWLLCPYDIPQLAIGGAGDVLAGCAGCMLMHPNFAEQSSLAPAAMAVITHAMAGFRLAQSYPDRGATASELANSISTISEFLSAYAEKDPPGRTSPWPLLD